MATPTEDKPISQVGIYDGNGVTTNWPNPNLNHHHDPMNGEGNQKPSEKLIKLALCNFII